MAKYIWFSGATDITGRALAEQLNLTGTKTRPRNLRAGDIIVGWGAKTNENVNINNNITVLNHPNAIRKNRNKLEALKLMKAERDLQSNVANFCTAGEVLRDLDRGDLSLPLVARTKFHQGGKGFWLCLTKSHVQAAINDGAEYFQTYIDVITEYRLHVAFGSVIYAVKKVENATQEGWKNQRREKIEDYNQKNNWGLDDATVNHVLDILVKEVILPDRIVRSNKRGWKFSNVRLQNVSQALKNAAVKSVEAIGLQFGAVDCALDANDHPFIIEVNSGPGLQGTALEKYVEAFRNKLNEIENPPARARGRRRPDRRAAVGAENANAPEAPAEGAAVNEEALVHMMNAVRSPEEARRVLDLMNRGE